MSKWYTAYREHILLAGFVTPISPFSTVTCLSLGAFLLYQWTQLGGTVNQKNSSFSYPRGDHVTQVLNHDLNVREWICLNVSPSYHSVWKRLSCNFNSDIEVSALYLPYLQPTLWSYNFPKFKIWNQLTQVGKGGEDKDETKMRRYFGSLRKGASWPGFSTSRNNILEILKWQGRFSEKWNGKLTFIKHNNP